VDPPRGGTVTLVIPLLDAIGYGGWILHALLALPLFGAALVARMSEPAAKRVATWVSGIVFGLSLGLWWAVDTAPGTLQLQAEWRWLPQWGVSYAVGIDGISLFMVLLATGLTY